MRVLTVPLGTGRVRLDRFLSSSVPDCSRRTAQRVIAAGTVRVNGRRTRKGNTVVDGDAIDVPDELHAPPALQPNPHLVVRVLYEDAALVAIDKPAGMPSHALRADETDTAANFLLARDPALAAVGRNDREAGIVHRLDTDTSGVLLAARTVAAYRALRRQFSARRVTKEYLAVVHGDVVAAGEVRVPLAHERHNRRKMRVCAALGGAAAARPAITCYRPIEHFGSQTLLAVEIPTGVMHQIRVHLASIGHPIVGDRMYGSTVGEGDPRHHLLHARRLTVVHPETGQPCSIESLPPAHFTAFVEQLRQTQRAFAGSARKARRNDRIN